MKTALIVTMSALALYTAWCAAFGPLYHDAYGELIRAAYCMDYGASRAAGHFIGHCR
jgi:hypothetical protein